MRTPNSSHDNITWRELTEDEIRFFGGRPEAFSGCQFQIWTVHRQEDDGPMFETVYAASVPCVEWESMGDTECLHFGRLTIAFGIDDAIAKGCLTEIQPKRRMVIQ